jgi:hypothetical protein
MPYSYECDENGENCQYVWIGDEPIGPSFHETDPGPDSIVGPGGEDLRPGGGGDITDPGQSTGGGGEPGRDVTVVGPGGEDLETSGVVKKEDGKWYDTSGRMLYDPKAADTGGIMGFLTKYVGKDTADKLKKMFVDDKGNVNIATLGALGAGIYGLMGGNEPQTTGLYKGKIPKYSAVRQQVEQPAYEPYSGKPVMGRSYFTDTQFVKNPSADSIAAAQEAAKAQAGILAAYTPNIAPPGEKTMPIKEVLPEQSFLNPSDLIKKERGIVADKNIPVNEDGTSQLASGGIAMLAKGRYLRGATDGMADKIPSSIDNKQPAKLSHGEFVIPADVVSHLGNGNSDAGANALYKMMDRVRKARTGTKKQGKRINPEKFTPGGIAGYKTGGVVAFQDGGLTNRNIVPAGSTGGTTTTGLAEWAGDAVTDYLGRGQALATQPYQAYTGPLSAGASDLQNQAFTKAQGLGGTFDAAAANQYMNPYIQNALQPQLNELRRQADISQQGMSGKYAAAGALGGARDAIARSEGIRNLLNTQSGVIGGAYKDAYDKAMSQYNISRQQDISNLNAMLGAGATQRGIEQEGITAQKGAFEQEREDPYNKLKFEQSLFTGLPLSATSTTPNLSELQKLGLSGFEMTKLYNLIDNFINPKPATPSPGATVPR